MSSAKYPSPESCDTTSHLPSHTNHHWHHQVRHVAGLVQDCSNSIANALELLQSCTKPSISAFYVLNCTQKGAIIWHRSWRCDCLLTWFCYQLIAKSCKKTATPSWPDPFAFLARWLTSARAYRIGGRKLCPSVCLYVKRYLLLQFCTDYNQTWINMIWAVAAKTLLSQIFHNWRRIEVNCVYISHCKWYRTSAGMPACIPNRRCCAGQCAGQ